MVLTPILNEKHNLPGMLESLIKQTVRPCKILIGDNQSTDGSQQIARDILTGSGVDFEIVTVARKKEIGKWNINNVYCSLSNLLRKENPTPDYVATIEADLVLEKEYFERLIHSFKRNPRLGIAGGPIGHDGSFPDAFPVYTGSKTPWGCNRLYSSHCWFELTDLVDMRDLPAWDSDHAVLAVVRGYQVTTVPNAFSLASRGAKSEKGMPKGGVDAMHSLPFWWAIMRFVQRKDPYYLAGFVRTNLQKDQMKTRRKNDDLESIRQAYRYSAVHIAMRRSLHPLAAER